MKYKVGDRVRVKEDLKNYTRYGVDFFCPQMKQFLGKMVTISQANSNDEYYHIEEALEWCWTDEMFEDIKENNMDNTTKELEELKSQYDKMGEQIKALEEEIKKPKNKKIKRIRNQTYFYVDSEFNIKASAERFWIEDTRRYFDDNYFFTRKDAEKYAKHLNTEFDLLQLIHKINEEEGCPKDFPNWKDMNQAKYYLVFSTSHSEFTYGYHNSVKTLPNRFYCYRNFTQDATKVIGEERLIEYFENI